MKPLHRLAPWLLAAACPIICVVGLYRAFFHSWQITASTDMPATTKEHYDLLPRLLGISSLVLLSLPVIGTLWHAFRTERRKKFSSKTGVSE